MFNELFLVGFDFDQEREQRTGPVKVDSYQLKDARGNPVIALFTRCDLADAFIEKIRLNWGLKRQGLPDLSAIEFLLSNNKAGVSAFAINPETYGTMRTVPLGDSLVELARLYDEKGVRDGQQAAEQ